MSIDRFKYLFQQFVRKTATPEETEEFLSMMKRDDYNKEVQALLDEFWQNSSSVSPLDEEKAEKIFNMIMASANEIEAEAAPKTGNGTWLKVVAAVIIIGSCILLYKSYHPETEVKSKSAEVKNTLISKEAIAVDIPTRRFINLPDGSVVILNRNSKLDYSNTFNESGTREVYLTGEAYFDIKHDASRPFIVHTGKIQTTVLGTAFNINENAENGMVIVTVTRGKVKVGDNDQVLNILDPNEQITVNKNLSQYATKLVKAETIVAWKNEDLYFDDVYLQDVAKELQDRFNISINFSNDLIKNCRFSATFLKTQSLDQILNVIGEFNHVKYQYQDKNTIQLDGTGCK